MMLHLTLEHAIIPWIQVHEPEVGSKALDTRKFILFQERLCEASGNEVSLTSLKEQIRYGAFIWQLVTSLGVLILPMVVCTGPGITTLFKAHGVGGKDVQILGTRLANNVGWMSLSQALAPVTVEIIFTESIKTYTFEQLYILLVAHPRPELDIQGIHLDYLKKARATTPAIRDIGRYLVQPTLPHRTASNILQHPQLQISMFPTYYHDHPLRHQVRLVKWLLSQPFGNKITLLGDGARKQDHHVSINLGAFTSLLPPGQIADDLIRFLGCCWNRRALPGWGILSPSDTKEILERSSEKSLLEIVTLALGGNRFHTLYENVVFAVDDHASHIFPVVLSFVHKTLTIYQTDSRASSFPVVQACYEVRNFTLI